MRRVRKQVAVIVGASALVLAAAGSACANNVRILYTFTGGNDGANPLAGLTRDADGNLYGTTFNGGSADEGVVFKLSSEGQQTVLHSFTGGDDDGASPLAGLIADADGNLYGTTSNGGPANSGVVFKLSPKGRESVLYSFTGGNDGALPQAGLIRDANGYLYGTTEAGGVVGKGVVFKLSPRGRQKVLHSFVGGDDGAAPAAGLIADAAGNLYGTTSQGGINHSGIVFRLSPRGRDTVLYSFTGRNDGGLPMAGLIRDAKGYLYGTTEFGGVNNSGVVFKVSPRGREVALYSFTSNGNDGSRPFAGLTMDANGNLYGTTPVGGVAGQGVVFKVSPRGRETVLHSFAGGSDGGSPRGGLIIDANGSLYGTALGGGDSAGVVFKVSTRAKPPNS